VEANLERQVVVLADHGRPERIYPMSSGKPSTPTVRGQFSFYSKTPGTNAHGMLDSNYFTGGYAIHGYPDVPNYAASHGCIRVPNPDAPAIYGWIALGNRIEVY
jgi:lipoprotein-anchoring transpeptidase ErfK/SrfK